MITHDKPYSLTLSLILIIITGISDLFACTNLIVTKGASSDGSVMITYAADSHIRYGAIAFFPAADHKPGDLCEVYHYENGKLLGTIPEVAHTYSVIQFMNEHQVAVGETTFGGLDSLSKQPGAILDYGSLMRIGLQRSKTAREMIKVMTELVAQYGYASGGESFSISDANEAWIMELIGITSIIMTRPFELAVLCKRSIASVAMYTAESNPKVRSVPHTSLSMVLGIPITFRPIFDNK